MLRNKMPFRDIAKGRYGRKIAYTDVETITADNISDVIGNCIGIFNYNKTAIEYLWNYYKGDQPVLYRTKVSNEDITNKVEENHAYEIVQFKVGQTYGEPVQMVSRKMMKTLTRLLMNTTIIQRMQTNRKKISKPENGNPP